MSDFKGRRFPTELILLCIRWYCKFGVSYRDLEQMMCKRCVAVDRTTLFRYRRLSMQQSHLTRPSIWFSAVTVCRTAFP